VLFRRLVSLRMTLSAGSSETAKASYDKLVLSTAAREEGL